MSEQGREVGAFKHEIPLALEHDEQIDSEFLTNILVMATQEAAHWFAAAGGQLHEGPCERWEEPASLIEPRAVYIWRGSRPVGEER